MLETIYELDLSILYLIAENLRSDVLTAVMTVFTYAGNGGAVWIAIALAMLFSKRHRKLGIAMAIGLVICLLLGNLGLKPLIARDRPFIADPSLQTLIPYPSGYSFPSGHTFSSFVSATVIWRYSKKAAWIAVPTAVIIAFSRLYFCVHFPTDVLAGAVLGIAAGLGAYAVTEKYLCVKREENPTE